MIWPMASLPGCSSDRSAPEAPAEVVPVGKKGRILLPSKKGLFRLSNESCKLWFLQATPTTDLRRVVGQLIPQYVANQGVGK